MRGVPQCIDGRDIFQECLILNGVVWSRGTRKRPSLLSSSEIRFMENPAHGVGGMPCKWDQRNHPDSPNIGWETRCSVFISDQVR